MPQTRSSSADSRGSAAESAGKSSNSSGSVLSRVLGSFRNSSRNGDATANSKEDPNWANNYKITHHPDRPRHDKRAGLRHRNSVYVLGQLRKIWKYNGKMTEMKRRERAAREMAFTGGLGRSGSQNQGNRDYERRHNERGDNGIGPGSLQPDPVPNFSRKASSPVLAGNRWQVGSEEQCHQYSFHNTSTNEAGRKEEHRGRPVSSPSSISTASDRMTIRVGLEVQSPSPYGEEESGGLKARPGRAETGGYDHTHNDISALPSAPPSAPRFLSPSPVLSQSASPFLSSEQKEAARRRQRRTLPHDLQQPFQTKPMAAYQASTEQPVLVNRMQVSSAREKALRKTMTPLHINTDQDSTPGLVVISSPASEQASPATPTDDVSNGGHMGRELLSTGLQTSKTCPMPLCDNPLLTAADQKQNLCAECRSDLQPRQSIFRTDVLNPVLPTHRPAKAHAKPHTSLASHVRSDSTAEVAEVRVKKLPPTARHISGESKSRTANRGGGNRSLDKVRATEILPPSSQKKKSGAGPVSSRFNKDRSEFRLQPAPLSRKHTRRGLESQLRNSPTEHQTTRQKPAIPLRDGSNDVDGSSHIGFQLAGWDTVTPSSARHPLQRKPSGPLLEPKTFRPATPPKKQNKDSSATKHRLPESRRRARGVNARSSGGRALSSPRTHVEKRGNHRPNEPTPNVLPPRSPGHRRNRQQPKQHHSEHRAVGRSANVSGNPTSSDSNTREINKKSNPEAREMALIDKDIYREIDNIIDCYLRVPGAPDSENEKRKAEAIASYFAEVPLDVEMKIKGFI
ncbi:hypothetical protein F5B21DRAFT_56622 [Xylaria acuta]|nr:hypothetical protein F5B21DRAFT_56622 [Xylaria acuta]